MNFKINEDHVTSFQSFQNEIEGFISSYLDFYHKDKFFQINVKYFSHRIEK